MNKKNKKKHVNDTKLHKKLTTKIDYESHLNLNNERHKHYTPQ